MVSAVNQGSRSGRNLACAWLYGDQALGLRNLGKYPGDLDRRFKETGHKNAAFRYSFQ